MPVKFFLPKTKYVRRWFLLSLIFLSTDMASPSFGQFIDFNRKPAYLPVFEQTDDFDTTYLTVLEKAFYQTKEDTLRLALLNYLAYYQHIRNLNKALFEKVLDYGLKSEAVFKQRGTGFGTQSVSLLTRQIDGKPEERNKNRTMISINFKRQMAA
jgi:hypothetical protein